MVLAFDALGDKRNKDPAPKWRWDLILPELTIGRTPQVIGFEPVLSLGKPTFVENVSLPFINVAAQPKFYGGRNRYYPTYADIQSMSVTFVEKTDYDVLRYMLSWQSLVISHVGLFYGVKADYNKEIVVRAFNIIDSSRPVMIFRANGWPTNIANIEYSYEESAAVTFSVEFALDTVDPQTL